MFKPGLRIIVGAAVVMGLGGLLAYTLIYVPNRVKCTGPHVKQIIGTDDPACTAPSQTPKPAVTTSPEPAKTPVVDKSKYSTSDPTSIWVVVNKSRKLSDGFIPPDLVTPKVPLRLGQNNDQMHLRPSAAQAMEELVAAASATGLKLMLASGYRPQSYQQSLYSDYVAKSGQAAADTFSARPGYSEHQTGLAFDIEAASKTCELEQCFGDTPEGVWTAAHAHEHGLIVRYGKDRQTQTGYEYEPWHLRYVGVELATQLYSSGQTLEQFFDLPPAPNYL